ncbi:MAG: hypothetical protein IJI11_00040 [Mogibacterium sp.]|nr:hypothetical protein [Mogibacterium sp.]
MMGISAGNNNTGFGYAATSIPIDEAHFPDAGFREYLASTYGSSVDPTTVTTLVVPETLYSVNNLEGIQYFTNLKELQCTYNSLTSLDVSRNLALESINVCSNKLTSLDVSQNPALKYLGCEYNNLSSLDVSHNPALESLFCNFNNISKLYVGEKLPNSCSYDDGVEVIYVEGSGSEIQFPIDREKDVWSFRNPPGDSGFTYEMYQKILNPVSATAFWLREGSGKGGLCYGMSQTVLASHIGFPRVTAYERYYNGSELKYADYLWQVDDGALNHDSNISAMDLIRYAHLYQYTVDAKKCEGKANDYDGIYSAAYDFQYNNGDPIAITLSWHLNGFPLINRGAHALAVIGIEELDNLVKIKVYDSNYPGADEYIALFGSPGHFTGWQLRQDNDGHPQSDGTSSEVGSNNIKYDIRTVKVTNGIINKISGDIVSKKALKANANSDEAVLLSISDTSQSTICYGNESIKTSELYETQSDNILPIWEAKENDPNADGYVYCWLTGKEKTVALNDLTENDNVMVTGNGTAISIQASSQSDLSVDTSTNTVQIQGQKNDSFTVSYNYPGEGSIDTIEVSGLTGENTSITPDGESVSVSGASSVDIKEYSIITTEDEHTHTWDECVITKAPTCTENGIQTYTCTDCGETKTESIPATGHKWNTTSTIDVAPTETAAGMSSIHCSVCGAVKPGSSVSIAALAPSEIQDLPAVKISKPKAAKKAVTVKWKKVSKKNLKKIGGIEIQVATDSGFTNIIKSTTAGKKKTSKKIKGLTSKQTVWVRIRAYKNAADGKHVSAWKSKKVKIK